MKPDWKDAPEWANWLAMDSYGDWYWFASMPTRHWGVWTIRYGLMEKAGGQVYWDETLEARP